MQNLIQILSFIKKIWKFLSVNVWRTDIVNDVTINNLS